MTASAIRLSILDQSVALAGRSEDESIRETIALAQLAERLGYHRFWVSEHHNHTSIVGSAPEILMAAIAATTRRIRVGSAGVMLPHYSAFKVAEQFRVLDAIAPGRIDLGLGRAPGSDGHTARALNPHADGAAEAFPAQVRDLLAWVSGQPLPDVHPFADLQAHPAGPTAPEPWLLGSSDYGAQVAAFFGLPYCFAHFITDGRGTEEALSTYRQYFRPTPQQPMPHAAVCVWALTAETEAEAQRLFTSRAYWKIVRDRGLLPPLPSPEAAAADPILQAEAGRAERLRSMAFIGTPDHVAARLRELAATAEAQELVVLSWAHDPEARRRSYTLLAREFGLPAE